MDLKTISNWVFNPIGSAISSIGNYNNNIKNDYSGGLGGYFGVQPSNSASNQASALTLDEYLKLIGEYSSSMTNAQRDIQQDFLNQQMAFNETQANIDRDRQDRAYQIMVKDLEKAGLSKLLAYNNNPSAIQSVGASVGLPNVARGSDVTSSLTSLANTNANKMSGFIGDLAHVIGNIFTNNIGLVIDAFKKK